MEIEELAAALRQSISDRQCLRGPVGPHQCDLTGCPVDDPDWVHHCYADDCDFTESEYLQASAGQMTLNEFSRIGAVRAAERIRLDDDVEEL